MIFLSHWNLNGNKILNLLAGTAATDAVNKSQLDAQTTGRLLGYFQIIVAESQAALAIPAGYQSKGQNICYIDSLLIPPQYIAISATQLTVNVVGFFLTSGTVTVHVYS